MEVEGDYIHLSDRREIQSTPDWHRGCFYEIRAKADDELLS